MSLGPRFFGNEPRTEIETWDMSEGKVSEMQLKWWLFCIAAVATLWEIFHQIGSLRPSAEGSLAQAESMMDLFRLYWRADLILICLILWVLIAIPKLGRAQGSRARKTVAAVASVGGLFYWLMAIIAANSGDTLFTALTTPLFFPYFWLLCIGLGLGMFIGMKEKRPPA